MPHTAYENAIAKRDALRKEIEKIEEFLALYQQFESDGIDTINAIKANKNGAKTPESTATPHRRKSPRKVTPVVLKDNVADILKDSGKPLSRREIVEAIEARGIVMPGTNKTGYIGSLLHRFKSEISSTKQGGYWFTGYEIGSFPESAKNH